MEGDVRGREGDGERETGGVNIMAEKPMEPHQRRVPDYPFCGQKREGGEAEEVEVGCCSWRWLHAPITWFPSTWSL